MFRFLYTFFVIHVIISEDMKYAKSIRKRKSHDMKEQGHSQSASLLAHERSRCALEAGECLPAFKYVLFQNNQNPHTSSALSCRGSTFRSGRL